MNADQPSESFEAIAMRNFPSFLALHERFVVVSNNERSFSNLVDTAKTEIDDNQAEITGLILQWLREHNYTQAAASLVAETGIEEEEQEEVCVSGQLARVLQAATLQKNLFGDEDDEVEAVSSLFEIEEEVIDSVSGLNVTTDSLLSISQICRLVVEGDPSFLPVIGSTYSCWSNASIVLRNLFTLYLQTDPSAKGRLVSSIAWFILVCNAPKELLNSLIGRFCNKITNMGFSKHAIELRLVLNRTAKEDLPTNRTWEDPQVPKNVFSHTLTLSDVPIVEVARQLTLLDFDLYKNVTNLEVLNQGKASAPNLSALLHRFNVIEQWVAGSILQEKNINDSSKVLEYFIQLAKCLLDMKSFSCCMAVMGGVMFDSVWRMKHLFSLLSAETREALIELEDVCNPVDGFKNYRNLYERQQASSPNVPFVQPYLQKVILCCRTTPTFVGSMVNLKKCFLLHALLKLFVGNFHIFPFLKVEQVLRFVKTEKLELELKDVQINN